MITLQQTIEGRIVSTDVERDDLPSHKTSPVKVSVIIPVYNAEHLLDDTLESVERQTLEDIEIICVNDASTDESLAVLEQHAANDPRITVVNNTCNSGTGTTINIGLSLASGKYVQYLGNDDLLDPDALEKLYEYCEDNDVDFCQYGIRVLNEDPTDDFLAKRALAKEDYHKVSNSYPLVTGPELLRLTAQNNEYHMSNGPQIVRKSLLDENGIRNLEGIHHEDMYYTYRVLLSAKRATLLSYAPYRYRIRYGSLETTKMERFHTAEEFTALLLSAAAMVEATPDELFHSADFALVVEREIDRYLGMAVRRYAAMPKSERERVEKPHQKIAANILPLAKLYAKDLDLKSSDLKKAEQALSQEKQAKEETLKRLEALDEAFAAAQKELQSTESELQKLKQAHQATMKQLDKLERAHAKLKRSYSYRIGHAITAVPRSIKKAARRVGSKK